MSNTDIQLTIVRTDLLNFLKGDKNTAIHDIWEELLRRLPVELKKEAERRAFNLVKSKYNQEDQNAEYLQIKIQNCSKELKKKLNELVPYIICLK